MYTLKMVLRNTRITLSMIAAVAALTFFLSVYTDSIQTSQEQLDKVYAVTTVTARISGFGGGATARLEADKYDRILSSGFVKSSHALIQQTVRGKDILRALFEKNFKNNGISAKEIRDRIKQISFNEQICRLK